MAEIRLICPGCGAEYRIPEAAIPPEGREVECSACSKVWHAQARASRLGLAVSQARAEAPPPTEPPRLSRKLPDSVLDILRDEVEHERRARASDESGTPKPDRPRAAAMDWPATTITRQAARPTAAADVPAPPPATAAPPPGVASPAVRVQPAPVGIDAPVRRAPPARPATPARARRSGYGAGFGLAMLIAASLVGLYLMAPAASDSGAPGEGLAQFRAQVDDARLWMQDRVAALTR